MNEKLLAAQRRELLVKAIDRLTQGDRSAFGRRLGFTWGFYSADAQWRTSRFR